MCSITRMHFIHCIHSLAKEWLHPCGFKGNTWNYVYGQAMYRGILKEYIYKVSWIYSLQKSPYPGNWLHRKLLFLKEDAVNIHVCKHPKIVKLCITDWSFLRCAGYIFSFYSLSLSHPFSFSVLWKAFVSRSLSTHWDSSTQIKSCRSEIPVSGHVCSYKCRYSFTTSGPLFILGMWRRKTVVFREFPGKYL